MAPSHGSAAEPSTPTPPPGFSNDISSPMAAPAPSKKAADLAEAVARARRTNATAGLSSAEVAALTLEFGKNELPEKKKSKLLQFLGYLWGPMPIMIWIAILVELFKGVIAAEGWEDFGVLMVLQFANATVGFVEESNAGDAIAALKAKLAPQCHVCRGGAWASMAARELVPGDLIELKIGDIVPADCIFVEGKPAEVDQAALTGESLPVNKHPWEMLLMGSALKRGEVKAVVSATGARTFFGKAAGMIGQVVSQGRLQSVLFRITFVLLGLSVVLCTVILAKLFTNKEDPRALTDGGDAPPIAGGIPPRYIANVSVVIVILVASIPIAIEVVCTATLALGSHSLSSKGIIVARLSAIEELAGMTVLCSDKTGTLTKNKLELLEPFVLEPGCCSADDIVFYAALCSKRAKGNQDAIDFAVTDDDANGLRLARACAARGFPLEAWEEVSFEPFNPTDKRTLAVVRGPDGELFQCAKGAPQVVLRMAHNRAELAERVAGHVQELGDRGYRALGVAVNREPEGAPEHWEYMGILSIYDPPRDDTKATIAAAIDSGIEVKMVTGDHKVIARETCRLLGMGTNILSTEVIDANAGNVKALDRIILESHGFAEVMPEHKFQIVERIRQQGHVTGMTGDGVNDAPALKRADVGIAVAGATDAARAASDLVLTNEGLSVIIDAIFESRKIFQRMRNYIIYRIACTIQLLFFFFFAVLAVEPDAAYFYDRQYPFSDASKTVATGPQALEHAGEFTLPVFSLVIITILNDGCMITISHDQVQPEKKPQRWAMLEMTVVAVVLGAVACASSLLLLVWGMHANILHRGDAVGVAFGSAANYITWFELRTIIYLKVSISDFLTLFSARTRTWFWQRSVGRLLGGAAVVAMGMSTLLALVWDLVFGSLAGATMEGLRKSGGAASNVWAYCIVWWLLQDAAKVGTYWLVDRGLLGDLDDRPPELPNDPRRRSAQRGLDANGEALSPIVMNPLSKAAAAAGAGGGGVLKAAGGGGSPVVASEWGSSSAGKGAGGGGAGAVSGGARGESAVVGIINGLAAGGSGGVALSAGGAAGGQQLLAHSQRSVRALSMATARSDAAASASMSEQQIQQLVGAAAAAAAAAAVRALRAADAAAAGPAARVAAVKEEEEEAEEE